VIEIQGLTKKYRVRGLLPKTALDAVSLTVRKGEVFGFLGPNGAGKTSLIKILVGLMTPDSGTAKIMGIDSHLREAKFKLGYLPESPYFHKFLTAQEFLNFHGRLVGLTSDQLYTRVPTLLEKVGLAKSRKQKLKTFSKGMLQRIGFAQALLHDPEVLILDEPMSGLDPVGRREVRDIINQIAMTGKTIFFSTHIIHDVEVICSSVAFITNGKLKGFGNIEDLLGKTVSSMEIRYSLPYSRAPEVSELKESRKTMDGWVIDIESPAEKLEQEVNAVLTSIISQKGTVRSVVPRKNSLEDLFFAGTDASV